MRLPVWEAAASSRLSDDMIAASAVRAWLEERIAAAQRSGDDQHARVLRELQNATGSALARLDCLLHERRCVLPDMARAEMVP